MPSGRTHDRITLWTLPWIIGLSYLLTRNGELTLLVAGGFLFSGLMFGPDLDIYSRQFQRWGKLRCIWIPYQKYLRHRSLLSHGFLIGTLLRVIYLLALLILLAIPLIAIAQLILGFDWNWRLFAQTSLNSLTGKYLSEAIAVGVGLELGAMSHSLSDWIGSAYKRLNSNKAKNTAKKVQKRRNKPQNVPLNSSKPRKTRKK
ncbi:conserved hypothetical protein [Gloeothece citriformis PCC 7424]|uniref:Metal-binding protein n=1 Tax=Gloeothece citriformis (strain PCC 7424) TaxID=65393 RepID=B7KDH5_GLOC7|nr:metal-binding protein [Gloeothece citriformis]ACK68995.1 conserved hypothetical protein [Gloeothece citriformis PCC 7424]